MPVAANKSDSGHMTPEDRKYACTVLNGWDKFADRDPLFCLQKCKCSHVIRGGSQWSCKKIGEVNRDIRDRIQDFEQAKRNHARRERITGKKYVLESFLRDGHNLYYSQDDLFPDHKVPLNCPFLLEYTVKSQKKDCS